MGSKNPNLGRSSYWKKAVCGRMGAFTMVELLVSIAIITLLFGILFPVVRAARAQSKKAVCASNLRQLGMASLVYAWENGGLMPLAYGTRVYRDSGIVETNSYVGFLAPYVSKWDTNGVSSLVGNKKTIFICPTTEIPVNPGATFVGSGQTYAMNTLVTGEEQWRADGSYIPMTEHGYIPIRISQIHRPAEIIMATDSSQVTDPSYGGSCGPSLLKFPFSERNAPNPGDVLGQLGFVNSAEVNFVVNPSVNAIGDSLTVEGGFRFRHLNMANVVMMDGHVETIKQIGTRLNGDGTTSTATSMKYKNVFPIRY
jgi:prepilin-type processing-associated H-X9-DG protein